MDEQQIKEILGLAHLRMTNMACISSVDFRHLRLRKEEFQDEIEKAIKELARGRYANEEVSSNVGYVSGYSRPKSITEQISFLRTLFSEIGTADEELADQPFPKRAEGWFAIPPWQKIDETYAQATRTVFDLLKQTRSGAFSNFREKHMDSRFMRQHPYTVEMFEKLTNQQKGHDILVVACQFGLLYRGRSMRRTLEIMSASEFGLGPYEVGIILLTHPERLQDINDLWIDCPGAQCSHGGGSNLDRAPSYRFLEKAVRFDARVINKALPGFGSATAFQ